MQKRPKEIDGFPKKLLESLPPDEQRRVRAAVAEESKSEEKHKKRRQRAAAYELDTAVRTGGRSRTIQVSDGPETAAHSLIFAQADDPLTALTCDLIRMMWRHLPLEMHLVAAARVCIPDSTITELADTLRMDEKTVQRMLSESKRLLKEAAEPMRPNAKLMAVELVRAGTGIAEAAKRAGISRATLYRLLGGNGKSGSSKAGKTEFRGESGKVSQNCLTTVSNETLRKN